MPNYTNSLRLEKPLQTENYNIDIFNSNADKIDTAINSNTDRISAIEVELLGSKSRLAEILTSKDVTANSSESLSALIEKVNSVGGGLNMVPGNAVTLYKSTSSSSTTSSLTCASYSLKYKGGASISFSHVKTLYYNGGLCYTKIQVVRGSSTVYTQTYYAETTSKTINLDYNNFLVGDVLKVTIYAEGQETITLSNLLITCDLV